MKKSMFLGGLVLVTLLAATPAMASYEDGKTTQQWTFDNGLIEIIAPFMYAAAPVGYDNAFGPPGAMISDLSGQGVQADDRGYVSGEQYKIVLDIPNKDEANPYKILTLTMRYQGNISFVGASGIFVDGTMGIFDKEPSADPVDDPDNNGNWKIYTQQFKIEPNPMEETVFIGLNGIDGIPGAAGPLALVDWIQVDTQCVPEPATLFLLVLGAGVFAFRKKTIIPQKK